MHSAWFRNTALRLLKCLQIKEGDLISGGKQFCSKSELFGPSFCIWILKVWWTQIFHNSLDFNAFCMIQAYFFRVLKLLQIKEWGVNFCEEPILQKVWIIWSPLLYFYFKSFLDPNSSSFIRFECILHDSGVLLLEYLDFYKLKKEDLISIRFLSSEFAHYLSKSTIRPCME